MRKLIGYEFRRARTALAAVFGAILVLEAYFLFSLRADSIANVLTATALLTVSAFAAAVAVFAIGISSYSGELRQKTSYLVFLTPNSALSVIAAKTLFTLLTALAAGGLLGVLCVWDLSLFLERYEEVSSLYEMVDSFLQAQDISLSQFYLLVVFTAANALLEVISWLVAAYLAVTFSATVMQRRRGRGAVTLLVYVLLLIGLYRLNALFVPDDPVITDVGGLLRLLTPGMVISLCVILASMFGSAWMLEKKVSL